MDLERQAAGTEGLLAHALGNTCGSLPRAGLAESETESVHSYWFVPVLCLLLDECTIASAYCSAVRAIRHLGLVDEVA